MAAVEDVAPLDSATEALRQRRLAARRSLVRALDSERYDRLIEDFTALRSTARRRTRTPRTDPSSPLRPTSSLADARRC
ncbi:MAG: CHAD domain-containing protein [Chloroflexia bacterium]